MSNYDLCMGCMSPLDGGGRCPKCGYMEGAAPEPGRNRRNRQPETGARSGLCGDPGKPICAA